MTVAPDYTDGRGCDVYADRGKTDRFQDVYKKYQTMEGRVGLAGHTPTGFAEYDADKKQYSSLMSKRVSDEVMKHSAQARAYLMYSDYKPPVVASLSESDLRLKAWSRAGINRMESGITMQQRIRFR